MTPFEKFFGQFNEELATVGAEKLFTNPHTHIGQASWDRKAAYLLWCARGRPGEVAKTPPAAQDDWDFL